MNTNNSSKSLRIHDKKVIPDYVVREVEVEKAALKPEDFGPNNKVLLTPARDKEGRVRPEVYKRLELVKDFDFTNGMFRRLCISERDVRQSKALEEFFTKATYVMCAMQDARGMWGARRFTKGEYINMVQRAQAQGLVAQYGKAKWPTGGGRHARSAGKFFFATEDITSRLYKETLKIDPEKLSTASRVSRTSILFAGPLLPFPVEPRVKYVELDMFGVVLVTQEFADQCGLKDGDKIWPIKASIMVVGPNAVLSPQSYGVDMVIPKDAVKFEEHFNAETLVPLLSIIDGLRAEQRSSVAKDNRLPRVAFDTAQWLWPQSSKLYAEDERLATTLKQIRRVVEGGGTAEEMAGLMSYRDRQDQVQYPMEGIFLLRGHALQYPRIRQKVYQAAGTAVLDALCFRTGGSKYGVTMPAHLVDPERRRYDDKLSSLRAELREAQKAERKTRVEELSMRIMETTQQRDKHQAVWLKQNTRTFICPPWMMPLTAVVDSHREHVVAVDPDCLVDGLGKDYDGDLGIVLHLSTILEKLGLSKGHFLDWTREEVCSACNGEGQTALEMKSSTVMVACGGCSGQGRRFPDKEFAKAHLSLPEKTKENDPRNVHEVMAGGLEAYGDIGRTTNAVLTVLDALRVKGTDHRTLMGLYLKLMSVEVQPFVDALKYNPKGTRPLQLDALAEKYGVDPKLAETLSPYFGAVRNMQFDELAGLPDDAALEGSFYYGLSKLFRGWKPVPFIEPVQLAQKLATKFQVPEAMERLRARSYRIHSHLREPMRAEARIQEIDRVVARVADGQRMLQFRVIVNCWANREQTLAPMLEQHWKLKMVPDYTMTEEAVVQHWAADNLVQHLLAR